jgi:hypothetical protein
MTGIKVGFRLEQVLKDVDGETQDHGLQAHGAATPM